MIQLLKARAIQEALYLLNILSKFDPSLCKEVALAICETIERTIEPMYSKISPRNLGTQNYDIKSVIFTMDEIKTLKEIILPLISLY